MRRVLATWAALGLLLALPALAAPCGANLPAKNKQVIEQDGVTLAFAPRKAALGIGRPFALDIAVCPAPRSIAVDADMPAHRHGMNYKPSVTATGKGRYVADGLLLHMPGHWRFIFDLDLNGKPLRLTRELDVQ